MRLNELIHPAENETGIVFCRFCLRQELEVRGRPVSLDIGARFTCEYVQFEVRCYSEACCGQIVDYAQGRPCGFLQIRSNPCYIDLNVESERRKLAVHGGPEEVGELILADSGGLEPNGYHVYVYTESLHQLFVGPGLQHVALWFWLEASMDMRGEFVAPWWRKKLKT